MSYADFLVNAIRFLNNVVMDVNVLAGEATEEKEIHVVINELIDVELSAVEPYVKARLKSENFQRIVTVKIEYSISVCKKDNVLAIGNRKDIGTVTKLKAKAMERLANSKKRTK